MNDQDRGGLEAYYREAGSWASDSREALRSSRRTAWRVAAAAAIIAVLEAISLAVMMPLKTIEPYTLLVDRTTGYVQALKPLEVDRVSADWALTQSFLVQYVIARESFSRDTVQADYRKVALWSAQAARSEYIARMQASNPDSPLARSPRNALVETRVKSVSRIDPERVMVRFETRRRDVAAPSPSAWVAIVRYRYSKNPMSAEDRMLNPLGFQVVSYRRDAEALPAESPPPAYVRPAIRGVPSPAAEDVAPDRSVRPLSVRREPEL